MAVCWRGLTPVALLVIIAGSAIVRGVLELRGALKLREVIRIERLVAFSGLRPSRSACCCCSDPILALWLSSG